MDHIYCPICQNQTNIKQISHPDFKNSDIWRCYSCNHWFTFPEPSYDCITKYYREIYSPQREKYFGSAYFALMYRRAYAQFKYIFKNLKRIKAIKKVSDIDVLDWGCGIGATVSLFRNLGAHAVGFDDDIKAISIGKERWSVNISVSSSSTLQNLEGKFNLLILSHLVEHLPDLCMSLYELLKVLKPGGWVFIEVPNSSVSIFTETLDTESHLHFFTQKSLALLLRKLELQNIQCVSCGPPFSILESEKKSFAFNFQELQKWQDRIIFSYLIGHPIPIGISKIKTTYDGYFNLYDSNKMWIRCLAQKL